MTAGDGDRALALEIEEQKMSATTSRRARVTATVAALLACGVGLGACGDDATEPTTPPSASTSSARTSTSPSTPANPDGARAIAVVRNYEKTSDKLASDPSIPTGELGAYATGQAYDQRTHDIRQSRARGERETGGVKIVEVEASKRSATSQQVVACIDLTGLTVTDKNGKEIDLPYDRVERIYTVEKSDGETQDGKWRVTAEKVKQTC
ncbi:MAG: hypothetical protein L0G89_00350 [Janibacter sp.]|nr:hypothetical protein [Janibacter sp.]